VLKGERLVDTVVSQDGTTIAFDRAGNGPPVVLINAGPTDRTVNAPLVDLLAPGLTVLNYDRRGRGDSGHTAPYAVDREYEDLEAVIGAGGGSAHLFGNSGGGILALEAAARGLPVISMAVWERPTSSTAAAHRSPATTGGGSPTCWRRAAGATWSSCS
jgi:pimeloyl-ACP methyl ester carboxylesterase